MKKFLYPALALSALALASCSSEEPVAGKGDSVTFNVTIPGSLSSRSTLGDQILAPVDNLQWTVYEVNGETKTAVYTASFEGTPFANGKTTETVTLNLGKGKTYQVVFYADNAANGAVSFTNGVLSVNYDAMATNTLAEDAFVGTSEAVLAGDPTNTVQLIRPFAQLNWGTSDLNDPVVAKYINPADGVTALTAQVTVTGQLYKSLEVITNTFSDEVTDATFGAVTAGDFSAYETEDQKVTFPAVGGTETYSLLAMNYLMPGTQGTATCTLAFNNGFESVEVNSVTLKQNFRTNIYGALLTNPTEFNVQIAPAFEEGDNNVDLNDAIVKMENGKVVCVTPALPKGVKEADLENQGGVYLAADGTPTYFAPTGKAVAAAMQEASEIFLAPNSTITAASHDLKVPPTGITVHGNGATITGSENDFALSYTTFVDGSSVDINISNINNVKMWGATTADCTFNINMKNCTYSGTGLANNQNLVMVRGGDATSKATFNITLDGCYCSNVQVGTHTTFPGTFTVRNCTFNTVGIPLNIAKKEPGAKLVVNVENSTFTDCGIPPTDTSNSAYNYAAPIRVVDNAGPADSVTLNINGCTITGTTSEWDVLLMDYRNGKTWFPVKYNITNSGDLTVRAE